MIQKFIFISLLSIFFQVTDLAAQRIVIIGLDGFSAVAFKTAKHPHIDSLFTNGFLSLTTRPVMPSVTLPNWTSHLSGSGPEEHGVTANNWLLSNHPLEPIATDEDGYYPSIFYLLKQKSKNIKTGYYYNWANLINSINKKYLDEVSFEADYGFEENYDKAYRLISNNRKDPVLVFLYSVHTDHAGHDYHWMSPQYISAIEKADSVIGNFINKLKSENLFKDTYFLLITDHGGDPASGHGGVSMDEMQVPWAITGPKIVKTGLSTAFNSNKNTSLVLAKIFGIKDIPRCWTGVIPEGVFK